MNTRILTILSIGFISLNSCSTSEPKEEPKEEVNVEIVETNSTTPISCETSSLGAFSISLNVKDLKISKEFYEKLGFSQMGGDMEMNYLIMKNGRTIIGLFQGMFEGNILTFNPGLDENNTDLADYTDIRDIQEDLLNKGISLQDTIDPNGSGPASLFFTDPDGNVILIDQFQ